MRRELRGQEENRLEEVFTCPHYAATHTHKLEHKGKEGRRKLILHPQTTRRTYKITQEAHTSTQEKQKKGTDNTHTHIHTHTGEIMSSGEVGQNFKKTGEKEPQGGVRNTNEQRAQEKKKRMKGRPAGKVGGAASALQRSHGISCVFLSVVK